MVQLRGSAGDKGQSRVFDVHIPAYVGCWQRNEQDTSISFSLPSSKGVIPQVPWFEGEQSWTDPKARV